ncbi:MAG: polyisoprenoid-binding protein [Candidatus Eremiobacteraeota bacterium]|nr:polyisoprenoid-binding protein [Candidatus Eremiobacteraeota bacterium]
MLRSFFATALFAACTVPALAADYAVDASHTQATFTVTHLAISRVTGKIPLIAGTVALTEGGLPTSINTTLSVKDIDTQSADRDRDLRSADWFETDKYPTMTFVSKSVSGTPQAFSVVGDLTFHGVTKSVTLTGKELGKISDARGKTHVGFTAGTTIDRRDWGLNWGRTTPGGELIAGYDVTVDLNVEVVSK